MTSRQPHRDPLALPTQRLHDTARNDRVRLSSSHTTLTPPSPRIHLQTQMGTRIPFASCHTTSHLLSVPVSIPA
jgi:hypothetical protein